MHSIIVVPGEPVRTRRIELAPGDFLDFGSTRGRYPQHRPRLSLPYAGTARRAGRISATGTHWRLTNLSTDHTYLVEDPEDGGEHITIAPGRVAAPVPFEFSRVVLPTDEGPDLSFEVWAPLHEYLDAMDATEDDGGTAGAAESGGEPAERRVAAYPMDRSKRYFLVLVALCAARLRGASSAPTPSTGEILRQLHPVWPCATPGAVQWNIDYLAVKLRLRPDRSQGSGFGRGLGERLNGTKDTLAALALRSGLVGEDDLELLRTPSAAGTPCGSW